MITKAYIQKNAAGKCTRPHIYSALFVASLFPYEILTAFSIITRSFFIDSECGMILTQSSELTREKIDESQLTQSIAEESQINHELIAESLVCANINEESIIQG